jgi:hypothetical protein
VCIGCGSRYEHGGNTLCFRSACQHMGKPLICFGCGDKVAIDGEGIVQAGLTIPWGRVAQAA